MFKFIEELKAKLQEKLSEKGQGMTEYAIILAVVAVVAVAVFMGSDGKGGTLGNAISGAYDKAGNAVDQIEVKSTTWSVIVSWSAMWIRDFKAVLIEKLSEEHAQGMVEYAIIIAVVAVISVAIFMGENGSGGKAFDSVNGLYDQANDAIDQIEIQNLDIRN